MSGDKFRLPTPPGADKFYRLTGADGEVYLSPDRGQFGGHRGTRIFGRLDCPSAARFVKRGTYQKSRVFFADQSTAVAAGYRPCAICMKNEYRDWKGYYTAGK